VGVGSTCTGDPEVSMHTCTPSHRIDMHGGVGEGIKGVHYMCACRPYNCIFVRGCAVDRRTPVRACVGNRHA
jgi:hypothetical protein